MLKGAGLGRPRHPSPVHDAATEAGAGTDRMCGCSRARRRLHRVDADPGAASRATLARLSGCGPAARRQPGDRRRARQERRADRRAVCPGCGDGDRTAGEARFSRDEDFVGTEARHPSRIDLELGITDEGHIAGLRVRGVVNSGAYRSHTPRVLRGSPASSSNLRRAPRRHRGLCGVHQHAGQRGVSRLWRTAVGLRHGARPRPVRPQGRIDPSRSDGATSRSGRVVRPEAPAGRPARHRAVSEVGAGAIG